MIFNSLKIVELVQKIVTIWSGLMTFNSLKIVELSKKL